LLFSIPGYGLPIQRQGKKKDFLVSASLQGERCDQQEPLQFPDCFGELRNGGEGF
jgi:hypothetical protein